MVRTVSAHLSPAKAAKRTGVSRWTIVRALISGDIDGHRNNRNHWQVDTESLDRWAEVQGARTGPALEPAQPQEDATQAVEVAVLRERVEALRERVSQAEDERDQARQDRDEWRDQAQQLARAKKPSWWPFS